MSRIAPPAAGLRWNCLKARCCQGSRRYRTHNDEVLMSTTGRPKRGVPEGLWMRCPQCKATLFRKEVESRYNVCPECQYHFYLPARERIQQVLDPESFEEWFTDLAPCDPLGFKDRVPYADRLKAE